MIKNQVRVEELLSQGWRWNQDQEVNPGQLDAPHGDSWYDAESDSFDLADGEVICETCTKLYDYADEPSEVKQGGTHVCAECWAIEE